MKTEKNYCKISNPTIWNEFTKMYCINPKDYMYSTKDFLWEYNNHKTGKIETHIISRDFIIKNVVPPTYKDKNGLYFRISEKNLLDYINYKNK